MAHQQKITDFFNIPKSGATPQTAKVNQKTTPKRSTSPPRDEDEDSEDRDWEERLRYRIDSDASNSPIPLSDESSDEELAVRKGRHHQDDDDDDIVVENDDDDDVDDDDDIIFVSDDEKPRKKVNNNSNKLQSKSRKPEVKVEPVKREKYANSALVQALRGKTALKSESTPNAKRLPLNVDSDSNDGQPIADGIIGMKVRSPNGGGLRN